MDRSLQHLPQRSETDEKAGPLSGALRLLPFFSFALKRWGYYLLLLLLAVPFLLPLLWMVVTAFKPAGQIYGDALSWLPNPPTTENFSEAWSLLDFPAFMRNSLLVTGLSMLGTLFSSSLVGYAFATLPARHKNLLFTILLATVMIPSSVTLIPLFVLFSKLDWVNTYLPLIVPHFFANAFYVFLFRQFYRSLSPHLFESAEIDGCNPWQAYWWIALPLSRPALATVAVFSFIGSWNDFLGPLIYLSSTSKFTLSLGLSLFHGLFYTQLQYLMPMSLVALLPVLLLFVVAQRYVVQGIVTTGEKEG
ncbi:MAG: carbohydrate ABC transporter permease [Chloroflexota bacterium]